MTRVIGALAGSHQIRRYRGCRLQVKSRPDTKADIEARPFLINWALWFRSGRSTAMQGLEKYPLWPPPLGRSAPPDK